MKAQGYIPKNVNVADSFLSYINKPEFLKKVHIEYSDEMVWSTVHFTIALQFLGKSSFEFGVSLLIEFLDFKTTEKFETG